MIIRLLFANIQHRFKVETQVIEIPTPLLTLLAEGETTSSGLESMLPGLMIIMVLFYFIILRPQRKKEQDFRSLIDNLKEKDRVVTIGGIHGVVTSIQRDTDLVTIRIDESTGAKMRIGSSAIARVVTDENKNSKST